jgi:hypothetical protein
MLRPSLQIRFIVSWWTPNICAVFFWDRYPSPSISVDLSSVTRPPAPGQISKLGAPALEGCGPLLDGPQSDHVLATDFLEFCEDCRAGGMLEP